MRSVWLVLWLWCMWLPACALPRPERGEKGFKPVVSTEEALTAHVEPRRWALVVGIQQYGDPTFDDLRYPSRDAEAVAAALRDDRYGDFDHVLVLSGAQEITRERILFELGRLRNDLGRQDTFVLYFSGHGTMEVGPDGQPHLYLVAGDTWAADLRGTAIDVDVLRRFLAALKPQRKVMILDTCFSGRGKSRLTAPIQERQASGDVAWASVAEHLAQSEAILMASTLGGVAREDSELGHGVYTHYLIGALTTDRLRADSNRDGAVTTYEAHDFARTRTLDYTRGAQIPEAFFRLIGRSEMFLSGRADSEVAASGALVYAYGPAAQGWQMSVGGQARGAFPGSVAVEQGSHLVTVADAQGHLVARGTLDFAPGQIYTADGLVEEINGYRRFFGVSVGAGAVAYGPAEALLAGGVTRLGLVSGYRIRGGALRGLSLSFDLGGADVAPVGEAPRWALDVAGDLVLRRGPRRLQAGIGWSGRVRYLLGDNDPSTADPLSGRWLMASTGPVVWAGFPIGGSTLLSARGGAELLGGDPRHGIDGPSVSSGISVGLEVGF